MASTDTTTRLSINPRTPGSSRETRRLRRAGQVPGVIYGGGEHPVAFSVPALVLRRALAETGAVVELELEGDRTPVVLKDAQRHPVRGETLHVDFLRVRLDQPIQATVALELLGAEQAPGVINGGVLEQPTREVTVEALPNDIPESIQHDVSHLEAGGTEHLSAVRPPSNVTLVDDLDETIIASITMPALEVETADEVETETGLVGEGAGEGAEADADAGDAPADAGDSQSE